MKFVMSCYGTRGEVEPLASIGHELLRRGHEVCIAVPPDLVGFVESAGLTAVAYELDTRELTGAYLDLWRHFYFSRNLWRLRDVNKLRHRHGEVGLQCFLETTRTLKSLADRADLLLTGVNIERTAANVAEYYDVPLVTVHYSPVRANGQIIPTLPSPIVRRAMTMHESLIWRMSKSFANKRRGELGLPETTASYSQQMTERGSLEIQAYDEVCFPGLAAEWVKFTKQRPFVGTLTMELPTDADEEVLSWIAAGTPPICFGFGSMPVESAADTLSIISAACVQLGERALVCSGWSDFSDVPSFDHVKVVRAVNYAAIFPHCRAVVHHGTSATAAGLRAGVPTLVLWIQRDQWILGAATKRLRVGTARRFSTITCGSLVADLRTILAPQYLTRAREIATQMTKPAESVSHATDLVENLARSRRVDRSARQAKG